MRLIDGHELYRQIPLKVCLPCPFGEEKECEDCVIDKVMKVIDEAPEVQIIKSVTMREGDTDGFFRKAVEAVTEV